MKVVHIVPALFGPSGVVGGAERYALELARQMAERVDDAPGHVWRCWRRRAESACCGCGCSSARWYVRGQRTNPFSLGLFRTLQAADVVHCHQHHVLASSAAAVWCRLTGKRVFVSDLGGGGWDVSAYCPLTPGSTVTCT